MSKKINFYGLHVKYMEVFNRINNHMNKFAYATYSEPKLDNWTFDDEDTIIINTSGYMNN
jgi:hypothetical protein